MNILLTLQEECLFINCERTGYLGIHYPMSIQHSTFFEMLSGASSPLVDRSSVSMFNSNQMKHVKVLMSAVMRTNTNIL